MHLGVVPMKPSLTGRWPHLADEEVGEARLERLAEEVGLLQDGVVRVEDLVQVVHVVRCSAQHTEGFSGSCTVEIEQAGSDYQTTPEGVASSFFATQLAPCHVNTADHVTRTLCSLCASASTLKGATLKWHLPHLPFTWRLSPGCSLLARLCTRRQDAAPARRPGCTRALVWVALILRCLQTLYEP